MTLSLMSDSHQTVAPWEWLLAPRQATTLAAVAAPRWLRVLEGRVWVTGPDGCTPPADHWLEAGQSLALPAGTAWVLEAWPQARLSVLAAAPAALSRAVRPRSGWLPTAGRWRRACSSA